MGRDPQSTGRGTSFPCSIALKVEAVDFAIKSLALLRRDATRPGFHFMAALVYLKISGALPRPAKLSSVSGWILRAHGILSIRVQQRYSALLPGSCMWKSRRLIGSFVSPGCRFAEGDSRVLQQMVTRDLVRAHSKLSAARLSLWKPQRAETSSTCPQPCLKIRSCT